MKKMVLIALAVVISGIAIAGATVELQKVRGVYIVYPGQTLTQEYDYVGTVEAGGMVKNWKASTMLEIMLDKMEKKNLKGDALIFKEDNLWKAEIVKFK